MSISEQIYLILSDFIDFDEGEVLYPEFRLVDDLQLNEDEIAGILQEMNEEFGLQLAADDAERFETVGDLMDYAAKH